MWTKTRALEPTSPDRRGQSSQVRDPKAVGRKARGQKEVRKAQSVFIESWLRTGSAGQSTLLLELPTSD